VICMFHVWVWCLCQCLCDDCSLWYVMEYEFDDYVSDVLIEWLCAIYWWIVLCSDENVWWFGFYEMYVYVKG